MNDIQVGNAPCSWGTLEFAQEQAQRIDCDTMLDELVETGYTGSELGDWGFMSTDPDIVAQKLAVRGLALTGAFVPVALRHKESHQDGMERCLQTAALLAAVSDKLDGGTAPFPRTRTRVRLARATGFVGIGRQSLS